MTKLIFRFIILILISHTIFWPVSSQATPLRQSSVLNFADKPVYLQATCAASTKIKVKPYKIQSVFYKTDTCNFFISLKNNFKKTLCSFDMNDQKDIFITGTDKKITCNWRAERLPKEF